MAGSNSSAVFVAPFVEAPPAMRTLPVSRSVAVCEVRREVMEEIAVNIPVVGSNSSAASVKPPAIRTLPLGSSVAVCAERGVFGGEVGVNVPKAESNSSAVFVTSLAYLPPVRRICPLANSVPV